VNKQRRRFLRSALLGGGALVSQSLPGLTGPGLMGLGGAMPPCSAPTGGDGRTETQPMIPSPMSVSASTCDSSGAARRLSSGLPAEETPRKTVPEPCKPDAWKKEGIVFEKSEPWEQDFLEVFLATPPEPLDGGRWRLWYTSFLPNGSAKTYSVGFAEGIPGQKTAHHPIQCFAEDRRRALPTEAA
jgi:hypothetical protein